MAQSSLEVANSALYKLGATKITSLSDASKEARICNDRVDLCKKAVLCLHPWNFAIKRAVLLPISYTIVGDAPDSLTSEVMLTVTSLPSGAVTYGQSVLIEGVTPFSGGPDINGWQVIRSGSSGLATIKDLAFASYDGQTFSASSKLYLGVVYGDGQYLFSEPSDCLRILPSTPHSDDDVPRRVEGGRIAGDDDELSIRYVYNVTDYTLMDPLFYECLSTYLAWDICDHLTADASKKRALWTDLFGGDGKVGLLSRARFVDATEDPAETLDASDWIDSRRSSPTGFVRDPGT